MSTITIPKTITRGDELIVIRKKTLDKLNEENVELTVALKAIIAGELALRRGKTRSFKDFVKSRFPKYAANY